MDRLVGHENLPVTGVSRWIIEKVAAVVSNLLTVKWSKGWWMNKDNLTYTNNHLDRKCIHSVSALALNGSVTLGHN